MAVIFIVLTIYSVSDSFCNRVKARFAKWSSEMFKKANIKVGSKASSRVVDLGRASKLTKGGFGWALEGWTFLGSTDWR